MNNPNLMYKHDADNPYPMFGLQCKYNQTSSCYPFIKYHCFSSIHKSFGRKKNYKLCIQIGNTPNYHGNPWLLRESILLPDSIIPSQSPRYQRYQNPKKERPTTHCDEPPYARNPLISSHFSTLSLNRTKFLWHYFWIAACAAVNDFLDNQSFQLFSPVFAYTICHLST